MAEEAPSVRRTSATEFLVLPAGTNAASSSGAFPPASRSSPGLNPSGISLGTKRGYERARASMQRQQPQHGTTCSSSSGEANRPLSRAKTLPTRSMPVAISEEEDGRDVAAVGDESTVQPAPVAYMYDLQQRLLNLWIWAQDADVCRNDGSSRPSLPPIQIRDQHLTYRLKCSERKTTLCVDLHLAYRVASTPFDVQVCGDRIAIVLRLLENVPASAWLCKAIGSSSSERRAQRQLTLLQQTCTRDLTDADPKELSSALSMAVDTVAQLRPDQHGYHWALAMLRQGQLLTHIALSICDNSFEFHRSLDRAEACFHKSLQIFFDQPHPRYWAFLQKCLADVDFYRSTNDKHSPYFERAIQGYNFALEVLSVAEWPSDWADMQMKLCSLYRRREHGARHDNLSRAVSHGVDAVNMLSAADVADQLSQAQLTLAKAYEAQGCVAEAVHFYSEALKVNTVASCTTVDNSVRLLQCLLTMPRPSLGRATSCLDGIRRDMQSLGRGPAINRWRKRTKVRTMTWEGVLLTKRQTRQGVNAEECERGIFLLKAVLRDSYAGIGLKQTANIYLGELFLLRRTGCSFENAEAAVACYVDALQRMPCASSHAQHDLEHGRGKLWILLGDALWHLYSLQSRAIKDDANEGAVLDYLCRRTINKAMMAYALAEKCTQRRQTYAQACLSFALAAVERQDEGDAWMAIRLFYQALRTLKLEKAELKLWLKGCTGLCEAASALLAGLDSPCLQAHRGCRLDSTLRRPHSPRVTEEFFLEGLSSTCALCELNTCKAALEEAVRVVPAKAQPIHAADVMPAVDALYCALMILSDVLNVAKSIDIELTDVELMTETLLRPLIIRQRASSEAVGLPSDTVARLLRESVSGKDSIDDDVVENVLRDISGELSVFTLSQPLSDFRRLVDS